MKYRIAHLLIAMCAVAASLAWWQLRTAWEDERVIEALNARPNDEGKGHVLYLEELTVYEDEMGREVPAPYVSRRWGWLLLGTTLLCGLGVWAEGRRRNSALVMDIALLLLGSVALILAIEGLCVAAYLFEKATTS